MAGSSESFFKKITYTNGIYPVLAAEPIGNPNRFFAIPLFGFLIKIVILIPVFIELIFVGIWYFLVVFLINPFVVLLTGEYWQHAYQTTLVLLRLYTKIYFFLYGLTNKYPGFTLAINDNFSLDILMSERPRRLYAIPILGILIRAVLLIPYFVFMGIIGYAAWLGTLIAWIGVLFRGKYNEGIFELARDSIRISLSSTAYFAGLSDKYPSFYISMKHDKVKLILIALSIIFNVWNYSSGLRK